MTTLGDLVNEILASLHSYTGVQEQVTWLTGGISDTSLSLPVNSPETAIRGITEVGDELVYIYATDSNGLSVAPFGRGYRGTTATSHNALEQVTIDPAWPRAEVKRAVNQAIINLYPTLYQIKTADLTLDGITVGYPLPDDTTGVLRVEWRLSGDPYNQWVRSAGFDVDLTSPSNSGKVINLYEDLPPGTKVRVVYQAQFGALSNDSDLLADAGLPDNYVDLLVYAVAARMIRFLDPARLQLSSVENVSRGQLVAAGDAGKIANQMYAMYQQRLSEERRRLLTSIPSSMNFSG